MKCQVCGSESGKYPLCRNCNFKKEQGQIFKCAICNRWHYANQPCPEPDDTNTSEYLYSLKDTFVSSSEKGYYSAIQAVLPENFCVFPQVNLASFIERTDNTRYRNELFRNVDFLITDCCFAPKIIIEINDQTHLNTDRKERDKKVKFICEEAGIPIISLWTSYGIDTEYIRQRINEAIASLPVARIKHSAEKSTPVSSQEQAEASEPSTSKKGCYVATCVFGSYDCPQVWTLRRYRDNVLSQSIFGKSFIRCYYQVSPLAVKLFGQTRWFNALFKGILNNFVSCLNKRGIDGSPYED